MGAGLRPGAKAPESPPDPNVGAPALDSTTRGQIAMDIRGAMHRATVIPESPYDPENEKLLG